MFITTTIGLIAALLTTLSFVPQVIKVLRSDDVSGVSIAMYALFSAGVALWLVYGLLIWSLPVILANGVTLLLCLTILRRLMRRLKG